MLDLVVGVSEQCTDDIERLRRACFVGDTSAPRFRTSARDAFDALSLHVVAHLQGDLVATCRLTPELPSVVQTWADGNAPVPSGAGVTDVSRIVVAPAMRGLGLCSLLMADTLALASTCGAQLVVGALDPAAGHKGTFLRLGFADAGEPVMYTPLPGLSTPGQTLAHDLAPAAMQQVARQRISTVTRLLMHGYRVDSYVEQGGSTYVLC